MWLGGGENVKICYECEHCNGNHYCSYEYRGMVTGEGMYSPPNLYDARNTESLCGVEARHYKETSELKGVGVYSMTASIHNLIDQCSVILAGGEESYLTSACRSGLDLLEEKHDLLLKIHRHITGGVI